MFRKVLGGLFLTVLVVAVGFAVTPASALAQKGGGGGGSGGSGGSGGGSGGSGGGGGSRDVPSLQAVFTAVCDDDSDAYGQAAAAPGQLGDGQSFSMQIAGVYSTGVVSVYINGTFIGYVDIDEFGNGGGLYVIGYYGGGIPVTAPLIRSGDELDIYDAVDDVCLLTGTFQ